MTALLSACVAFQLNASMLSPVLPTLARELKTDSVTAGLSQTAFFTSACVFAVFVPRLSDIAGRRRTLVVTLGLSAVGSVLAALSPTIEVLYIARILQGCCGPVIAICLLMLRDAVPEPRRYGTLMGVVTAVNGGIAGVDVIVGGAIATRLGFRPVFWLMAVAAVVAMILVRLQAPETRPSAGARMDWLGVGPLVVGIGTLLIALGEVGKLDAANWLLVGVLAVLSLGAFGCFHWVEGITSQPLVSRAQLRHRATWSLLLTTTLTLTGVFAAINGLVVSFAQDTRVGFGINSDTTSLLLLTPYALIGWLIGPLAGRLAPRRGYLWVLRVGLAGSVVTLTLIATVGLRSLALLIAGAVLLGIAYAGMANIMLNGLAVVLSGERNPGFLPGINTGAFNLGAGLSFAVLPVVQIAIDHGGSPTIGGYAGGIGVGAGIVAAALASSYLIPRPAAAELPEPRHAESDLALSSEAIGPT
ncbi:MFS transporter [Streptomyces hainanensis]|nr:MFS transporter [Streptomyces hainanensis]